MPLDPDEAWRAAVGGDPTPYELKHRLADRWVRFWSLPDGKRYPTESSELTEVLRRGNILLAEASATDDDVLVVSGLFGPPGNAPEIDAPRRQAHPEAAYWRECEAGDDEDWVPHLFASTVTFTEGALNGYLEAVAEDRMTLAMIVAPGQRIVVHPYDGGFDVILPDPNTRDLWRARHRDWASSRSHGL